MRLLLAIHPRNEKVTKKMEAFVKRSFRQDPNTFMLIFPWPYGGHGLLKTLKERFPEFKGRFIMVSKSPPLCVHPF